MSSPADSPRRILIVEDHALVAKFYRLALERAGGFTCLVTENVGEMLEETRAGRVDLAILDVSLSGTAWEGRILDGIELSKRLKQAAPRRLPIVLATAHAMTGDRERLLAQSGADDYLQKPIYDAQLLVEKIRRLVQGSTDAPDEHA